MALIRIMFDVPDGQEANFLDAMNDETLPRLCEAGVLTDWNSAVIEGDLDRPSS